MSERPTPETDDQPIIYAFNDNGYQVPCVDIEFARKLERERDEARAERDILRLNSLGTIQLNIPVTTDWRKEIK